MKVADLQEGRLRVYGIAPYLCKNCLVPQRLWRRTFLLQMASDKSYRDAKAAIVVVTWHSRCVLWGFSTSTLNSTLKIKMRVRTPIFLRTGKIEGLKVQSWSRGPSSSTWMLIPGDPCWVHSSGAVNRRELACTQFKSNVQLVTLHSVPCSLETGALLNTSGRSCAFCWGSIQKGILEQLSLQSAPCCVSARRKSFSWQAPAAGCPLGRQ